MANKGIPKFPLFDSLFQKMSFPLFGVPTVYHIILIFEFGGFIHLFYTEKKESSRKLTPEVLFLNRPKLRKNFNVT